MSRGEKVNAKTPVVNLGDFADAPELMRRSVRNFHVASRSVRAAEANAEAIRARVKSDLMRGTGTLTDSRRRITATVVEVADTTYQTVDTAALRADVERLAETAPRTFDALIRVTRSFEAVDETGKRLPKAVAHDIDGRLSTAALVAEAIGWTEVAAHNTGERDKAKLMLTNTVRGIDPLGESSVVYIFDAGTAPGGIRVTAKRGIDLDIVAERFPELVAARTTTRTRVGYTRLDLRRITDVPLPVDTAAPIRSGALR